VKYILYDLSPTPACGAPHPIKGAMPCEASHWPKGRGELGHGVARGSGLIEFVF